MSLPYICGWLIILAGYGLLLGFLWRFLLRAPRMRPRHRKRSRMCRSYDAGEDDGMPWPKGYFGDAY